MTEADLPRREALITGPSSPGSRRFAPLTVKARFVNWLIKRIARILCRVDAVQLDKVPAQGPLILVPNHVNFLDTPVTYTHLLPRPLTGLVKKETWEHPILGPLFQLWGGIPIRRGEADLQALRLGLEALEAGMILAIAPEGTRSGDGRLGRGHPGVAILALRSGAPLLPVALAGLEDFWPNFKRLRRTDFHITVGDPFYLDDRGRRVDAAVRQQMVDEIMYQLAALLPAANRGVYADLEAASDEYLRFPPESTNHLRRARGV
jgi:1-acyl-sn-glycerol-3-phosphate acyltransferase